MNEIDLVIFEVAGSTWGVDLGQVRRIDVDEPHESIGHPLGTPLEGKRALVFEMGRGVERRLAVDVVHGVSRVKITDLRRMPAAAHVAPFSIGAWIDGETPILLVDLPSMVPPADPSSERTHGH